MGARVKANGDVVCAEMFPAEEGDIYINANLHYELAVELGLLAADLDHKVNGLWHWSFPQSLATKARKEQ